MKNKLFFTPKKFSRFRWRNVIQYFLQGLLVIAPIAITIYGIYYIVTTIDSWLPLFTSKGDDGKLHVQNYGLGFVIIVSSIILIGYLSSFFIESKIFNFFERWIEKTPGVKLIYSTVKDFFEAFAGENKKFDKPVIANVDDKDVWRIGFITQKDMSDWGLKDYVAVYIPLAFSIAGNVYLIPISRVRPITDVSSAEAMKFAISGGLTEKTEEKKT